MNTPNKIKVAALTGRITSPASRVRIRQYIKPLAEHGIVVEDRIPYWGESCGLPSPFKMAARIPALYRTRDADVIWISRSLVQGYATFERMLKRPRVMDVDDAIWLNRPFGNLATPYIAKGMDTIVVGNSYLADYFSKYCKDIHIIPTSIDLNRYTPRNVTLDSKPAKFTIGWTGLACNYQYMELILPALKSFLADHNDAELVLLSNKPWQNPGLPQDKVRFVSWSEDNAASALHEMSVGIMPLKADPWTRGKCSFKMLQYMAAGLPVIASPFGMNADVMAKGEVGFAAESTDQWYQALEALYKDWNLQIKLGNTGRKVVEEHYSAGPVAAKLAQILKTTAG